MSLKQAPATQINVARLDGNSLATFVNEEGELAIKDNIGNVDYVKNFIPASGGNTFTATAATPIGGHRLVVITDVGVEYFQASDTEYANKQVGFSTGAAEADALVTILPEGELVNPGWGLTQGAVYYAANNGLITRTAPNTGICLSVGVAKDSNTLIIGFSQTMVL